MADLRLIQHTFTKEVVGHYNKGWKPVMVLYVGEGAANVPPPAELI